MSSRGERDTHESMSDTLGDIGLGGLTNEVDDLRGPRLAVLGMTV